MNIINPYRFSAAAVSPTQTDVVAWWEMEELGGTNRLDELGTYTLTDVNAVGRSTDNKVGTYSANINGVNNYLSNSSFPRQHDGDFSVCCWFIFDALPTTFGKGIAGQYTSTNQQWVLSLGTDDRIAFVHRESTPAFPQAKSNSTISTGTWYHVVGVRSGDDLLLWVDGVEQSTTATITPALLDTASTVSLEVGRFNSEDTRVPNGRIDSLGIFNKALTDSEINFIYNGGSGGIGYADL